jgi:peptidoglycan/LPS O-acetylase OafA/YrhL
MPQLDGLRFLAIVAVLVEHAWRPRPLPWIFGGVSWGGLGVRLFFVLSGFLITGILLDCRTRAEAGALKRTFYVRQFYARRFLRIFPLYYGVLTILVVADFEDTRRRSGWLFTYTTNIFFAEHGWHDHLGGWHQHLSHFWTLAVEEQFYLVWPLLVLFLPRRALVPLLTVAVALAPLYRLYAYHRFGLDSGGARNVLTPSALDSLGIGALVAIAARRPSSSRILHIFSRIALPLSLAIFACVLALQRYGVSAEPNIVVATTATSVAFGWLVWRAASGFAAPFGSALEFRPVRYVGKISYGVYIFHYLVIGAAILVAERLGVGYSQNGILNFLAIGAVTLAIAAFSWHFFERPISDLKQKFAYRAPTTDRGEPALPVSLHRQPVDTRGDAARAGRSGRVV